MYLTKRQKEILDFVREQVELNGYAPTLQEIGLRFGLSSPATVYKHVEQLVHKGYLRKAPHQGRGIQLVDPERMTQEDVLGLAATDGRPLRLPRGLVFSLGKLSEYPLGALGRESPVGLYRLRSALSRVEFGSTQAEQLLGWRPRVGVHEGIRRVLAEERS